MQCASFAAILSNSHAHLGICMPGPQFPLPISLSHSVMSFVLCPFNPQGFIVVCVCVCVCVCGPSPLALPLRFPCRLSVMWLSVVLLQVLHFIVLLLLFRLLVPIQVFGAASPLAPFTVYF